jgi:hypothetical protein
MLCKICGLYGGDSRTPYSGMLRRVTLVRTDVSEEFIASIKVTGIGELGTIAVASNETRSEEIRASVATYC